jgi:hypothetical protein
VVIAGKRRLTDVLVGTPAKQGNNAEIPGMPEMSTLTRVTFSTVSEILRFANWFLKISTCTGKPQHHQDGHTDINTTFMTFIIRAKVCICKHLANAGGSQQ